MLNKSGLHGLDFDKPLEIPRAKLTMGKRLGHGAFGLVHKATVDDLPPPRGGPASTDATVTEVAAKMCKSADVVGQARIVASLLLFKMALSIVI